MTIHVYTTAFSETQRAIAILQRNPRNVLAGALLQQTIGVRLSNLVLRGLDLGVTAYFKEVNEPTHLCECPSCAFLTVAIEEHSKGAMHHAALNPSPVDEFGRLVIASKAIRLFGDYMTGIANLTPEEIECTWANRGALDEYRQKGVELFRRFHYSIRQLMVANDKAPAREADDEGFTETFDALIAEAGASEATQRMRAEKAERELGLALTILRSVKEGSRLHGEELGITDELLTNHSPTAVATVECMSCSTILAAQQCVTIHTQGSGGGPLALMLCRKCVAVKLAAELRGELLQLTPAPNTGGEWGRLGNHLIERINVLITAMCETHSKHPGTVAHAFYTASTQGKMPREEARQLVTALDPPLAIEEPSAPPPAILRVFGSVIAKDDEAAFEAAAFVYWRHDDGGATILKDRNGNAGEVSSDEFRERLARHESKGAINP